MNKGILWNDLCSACGISDNIEQNHIIPIFMGRLNEKETIPLCSRCHDVWHHHLNKFIYNNRKLSDENLIKELKNYLKWFCKNSIEKNMKHIKEYWRNHCRFCKNHTRFLFYDYENRLGVIGVCEPCWNWTQNNEERFREERQLLKEKQEFIPVAEWVIDKTLIGIINGDEKDDTPKITS